LAQGEAVFGEGVLSRALTIEALVNVILFASLIHISQGQKSK